MFKFRPDGGIELEDGRIIYLDSKIRLKDFIELNKDPLFNTGILAGFPARASAGGGMGGFGGGGGTGGAGTPGADGVQGIQGPFGGPQGNQGFQGMGFQGAQGAQGFQGNGGNQGNQGPQGWEGFQGAQGRQGFQGTGSQGPQGIAGAVGVQGAQGAQGWQGVGSQGSQGPQGFQGFQGPQGFQGIQGAQGWQGWQGFQGLSQTGVQGAQGFQTNIDTQFSNLNEERKVLFTHSSIADEQLGVAGIGGSTSVVKSGTESTVLDGYDNYVNYSSVRNGWSLNTTAGITNQYFVSTLPIFLIKIKTGPNASDVNDHRMWHGFMSWDGTGLFQYATADSDTPAENIIAFRCAAAGADVNWKAVTDNGSGTPTVTDTGVAIVADTKYTFIIDCRDAASIKFYINGVLVATNTLKIPTTGFGMLSLGFKTASARNTRLSIWYMTRY